MYYYSIIISTRAENCLDSFVEKAPIGNVWGELRILIGKRNNEGFSTCLRFSLHFFFFCVCTCWGFELCEGSPSWLLFSSNPCFWDNPANDFWGSVPDVSRASVSFGASFSLESLLSFESPKPMSVGTQAKLIILVMCLAKQVRPEWIVNKMVILLCSECAQRGIGDEHVFKSKCKSK